MKKREIASMLGGNSMVDLLKKSGGFDDINGKIEAFNATLKHEKRSVEKDKESRNDLREKEEIESLINEL